VSALARRLAAASAGELAFLEAERKWAVEDARQKQVVPIDGWNIAVIKAGRGWGKTKVGAAWIRRQAGLYPGVTCHVVAPTYSDLRGVIFGGPSGLIASIPMPMIAKINHSLFEILLWNGSVIRGFSADTPDRLRGPQCHFCWGDEVAAWGHNAEAVISNIDLSTRLRHRTDDGRVVQPQRLYTTTPRPLEWLKTLMERPNCYIVNGTTMENSANLAEAFIADLEQYKGTQVYRQEVLGELIDVGEAAIIKRSWLKLWPNERPMPWFDFVLVSLDTAFTEKTFDKKDFEADYTACSVWGVFPWERKWNMMLLECWHEQIGFPELIIRARREMNAVYGERRDILFKPMIGPTQWQAQKKKPDLLIIEDKGAGISLRQTLEHEGISAWPYNPGNADKLSRLHAVSHVAASGRIWLPESKVTRGQPRTWAEEMLKEVCVYSGPGTTRHDDFVDSFSQASRYFADRWLNAGVAQRIADDSVTVNVDDSKFNASDLDYLRGRDGTFVNPYDG
jgi:phage terminase large subunit-like protein